MQVYVAGVVFATVSYPNSKLGIWYRVRVKVEAYKG